jgi:hypothetical protein
MLLQPCYAIRTAFPAREGYILRWCSGAWRGDQRDAQDRIRGRRDADVVQSRMRMRVWCYDEEVGGGDDAGT